MVKSYRYPYFLSGTDVGLRMITIYIFFVYLIWSALAIAMSSLPDPSLDYSRNPKNITSIPPASTLAALYSPLNTLIQAHFREYGHDAIDTVLALFCVWSSVHTKTRQQRILAVVASIWTSFSWFIYARYTIQAFGYYNTGALNPFCVSTWKSFPAQPALNINVPLDPNYCIVMRGTAVCSLLLLLGRILLTMYAFGQFYETKGEEPYCKIDKEEIQRNTPEHQQLLDVQQKQPALADIVIQSQPQTAANVTVSGKGISSPSECSLTRASHVMLFFIGLTLSGFIITMLSFIELIRLDHQQSGILFKALGNRLFDTVMVYPMLKVFFSVALGAFAAYDRVRENLYNPLLINFLGTLSLWGLFIYGARRLTLTNCPNYANGENCMEYPASQRAMVAGWGIMACSELLRMGVMIWKIIETPKTPITNAMMAAKAAAVTAPSSRLGRLGYAFCNSLYLLIIFAYFLVILAEQSMTGLFQVQPTSGIPKVGFVSPFGQSSVEDILEWPYHNFAISILSMGWMMGTNHYVDLGGTRSSAFASFLTQVIHCGVWLALCFPPAYAMFTSDGYFHDVWCVDSFTSIYGNDPCNYITASGRLAILFFAVMVINTCINGIRLLSIEIETRRRARAAQPGQEISPTGCVRSNSPWLFGEMGLWLTVFGWMIYCLAAANEGQKAYFVGDEIDSTFGFNLFQFIAVHYFSVAILIGPGMTTAHLLTNREYRQNSYGWRLGQIVTFIFHISFLIVIIVILARYVYNLDLNQSQLAMFSGLVILLAGDVFSFVAFRAYFLARPVVRFVPGPLLCAASSDTLVNKVHVDDEIAMVPINANTVTSADADAVAAALAIESNSAHHSSHSNSDPQKGEFQLEVKPMEQVTSTSTSTSTPHQDQDHDHHHDQHHKHNNTNTHWHMDDQDDE